MLFWGQWNRMNAVVFLMHIVIEIMNSTPENVHSKEVAEWKYQRYLQDYMGVVASVDESVGEILDYLKRTGLDKKYDCSLYYRSGLLFGRTWLV